MLDERVRLGGKQPLVGMDPTPADRDRVCACGVPGLDVERRVADVHRVVGGRTEAAQSLENRVGIGLVPLSVVGADENVRQLGEKRETGEGEVHGRAPLGRNDAELVPAIAQLTQELRDPVEDLERRVQRLVVGAIDIDELLNPVRIEIQKDESIQIRLKTETVSSSVRSIWRALLA